jgi:hypothetical protein
MQEIEWPFLTPIVYRAIDGQAVPTPVGWTMGGGTWGCLQSHRQILEAAIMDGVQTLFVLEDDAVLRSDFVARSAEFLAAVPCDWDQLMLGGQHISPPSKVKPGVLKCTNSQRTHAYAIRGKMLRDLYALWCAASTVTHCDHVMGPFQRGYNVYAPDPFLFGQSRTVSDISGAKNPQKFWQSPRGDEPIFLLRCPRRVVGELRARGVHTGYQRHPESDLDLGLIAALTPFNESRLRKWVDDLQWEVASETGWVLGVWHPAVTPEMLRSCWKGPLTVIDGMTVDEALEQCGPAVRRNTPRSPIVVLLRGTRETVAALRSRGWHTGNWRDPVTDLDQGLRRAVLNDDRALLRATISTLASECDGIVCLWHEQLELASVRDATDLEVVEISAGNEGLAVDLLEDMRAAGGALEIPRKDT